MARAAGAVNPITNEVAFSDLGVTMTAHPVNKKPPVFKNEEAVKRAIKNLILTSRFERPYEPLYGCNIYNRLFENFDPIEAFNQTAVSTSIDYGLLEKANGLQIQELDSEWIDLGSWDAYVDYFDNNSNDISSIDVLNNSVVSFTSQEIVVIGLDDIIVVNHPNGILVTKKGQSQKVNQRKK